MAKTQFLQYTIHLTDKDRVEELQGTTDPGSNQAVGAIIRAPYNPGPPEGGAAIEFEAPILEGDAPFAAPCITSPWFGTDANFPLDVATFTRKSGGWFGIPLLFGETTRYYWRGVFEYAPPLGESEQPGETPVAMAQRRWIDGFEMPNFGDGGAGGNGLLVGRAYSRHVDGFGCRFDDDTNERTHTPTETRGGTNPREMWERFYIRPRVFGSGVFYLHKTRGATSASAGIRVSIISSGQLFIENISSLGNATPLGTVAEALTLNRWVRVDILWRYNNSGAPGGYYALHLNGVNVFTFNISSGSGLGQSQLCQGVTMGGGTSGHGFHVDVDDWIGADWPTPGVGDGPAVVPSGSSVLPAPGLDWNNGSRVVHIKPTTAAATDGTWTGNKDVLGQRPISNTTGISLTTTTALNRVCMLTDVLHVVDKLPRALGIICLNVARYGARGTTSGQLGYKLPGESEVLTSITESVSNDWQNVNYQPTGLEDPLTPLDGLELTYVKGNDATSGTLLALQATAEVLGKFYDEDTAPTGTESEVTQEPSGRMPVHHNGPYEDTPWAQPGPPPISGVIVAGGTYTGNGTTTELTFNMPIHFVMIRNTANSSSPIYWWASHMAGHPGGEFRQFSESPIQVVRDRAFAAPPTEDAQSMQFKVRISGNAANSNQAAATYQYIVFGDAGMRFSLCDGVGTLSGLSAVEMLAPGWTPEVMLLQSEDLGTSSTIAAYFKGLGSTGTLLGRFANAAAFADALTIGTNSIQLGADLISDISAPGQLSYMAFRRQDGNDDPDEARVMQLATWTGDGSASRTISLAPASGRRPLFALVVPHNTAYAHHRDPSHTGTTSQQMSGTAQASSGIASGGIDQVGVGSTLNANGVIYDMIVFPGSATAGNNGWSVNGTFYPVEPDSPVGDEGVWGEEPDEPGETPDPEPPEPPSDAEGEFDFSDDCVDASTLIINKALSYIGVSKQVGDITTEASLEAVTARLHYSDDVSATLRDYPWAFATRYEELFLVRGDATDQDLIQAWDSGIRYAIGDVVEYNDTPWYALASSLNSAPVEGATWTTEWQQPANGDWTYAYRVPERMMFARRIVNPNGVQRDYDENPVKFRVGADDNGGLIYTNERNPELEYTLRLECVASSGDSIFRKALTWRHASSLAPALSKDGKTLERCLALYVATLSEARSRDAQEQQQAKAGDVDWITGRE